MHLIQTSLTDSTNTQIQVYPLNTILLANCQSAGRGRYGNQWLSAEGGIYFSYKIKNPITKLKIPFWSIAIGIACHKAFESLQIKTLIKWPNDIYNLKHQKVAGILLETVLNKKDELIIGIGINYQNHDLPADYAYLETKMSKLSIVNLIIQNINKVFNYSFADLKNYYQDFAYIQPNSLIHYLKVNDSQKTYTALVKDILESGELLIVNYENQQTVSVSQLNSSEVKKIQLI